MGDISVDQTGAIIITGASYDPWIDYYDGDDLCLHNIVVCRYWQDGIPDSTFGEGGVVRLSTGNGQGNALLIYPDRRILVAGASGVSSSEPLFTYFARLLPDGTLDATFSSDGSLQTQTLFVNLGDTAPGNPIGLLRLPGRIIVGILISIIPDHLGFGTLALTEEGTIDSTFGSNGKLVVQPANAPICYINEISSTNDDNFFLSGYFKFTGANTMIIAKIKVPETVSVISTTVKESILIYPNPVDLGKKMIIDIGNIHRDQVSFDLSIFDIYGRLVYRQICKDGTGVISFDTSTLISGVYIAILNQEGKRRQGRFIVQE